MPTTTYFPHRRCNMIPFIYSKVRLRVRHKYGEGCISYEQTSKWQQRDVDHSGNIVPSNKAQQHGGPQSVAQLVGISNNQDKFSSICVVYCFLAMSQDFEQPSVPTVSKYQIHHQQPESFQLQQQPPAARAYGGKINKPHTTSQSPAPLRRGSLSSSSKSSHSASEFGPYHMM